MTHLAPWLLPTYRALVAARAQDRVPHAILISGAAGIGKMHLIREWLRWLQCHRPGPEQACGTCDSCVQHAADGHPDCLYVEPEEAGKEIRIDAVRNACFDLELTSHYNGYRALVIRPAESLNRNAANALLKTLEEAPRDALLILSSNRPAQLPATVLSRCRKLRVAAPDAASARDWLAAQAGCSAERAEQALLACLGRPYPALALLTDEDAKDLSGPQAYALIRELADGRGDLGAVAEVLSKQPLVDVRAALSGYIEQRIRDASLQVRGGAYLAYQQQCRLLFELWDQIIYWPIDRASGLDLRLLIEEALIRLRRALDVTGQGRAA